MAGRLVRRLLVIVLGLIVLSAGAVLALRRIDPPVTAVMLLEPGPVDELMHLWVPRNAIAREAVHAVIAAEDQRFADHHGIDFDSLGQAIADFRDGDGLRGASTITQQVAKNVFLWQGRSFVRKGAEAWFAVLLELFLTKQRILEIYLNVAEFGPGLYGIEAAAREHFGKSAVSLSRSEAALLAAVLPNPRRLDASRPTGYVRERQAWIVAQIALLETRGHYRGIDW